MNCRTDDGERFNSLLAVATFSAQIAFAVYPERRRLSVFQPALWRGLEGSVAGKHQRGGGGAVSRRRIRNRVTQILGYAIYDINRPCDAELMALLRAVPHTIAVRAAGC